MRITDCRVNHLQNPIGFAMDRTVFSWKVTDTADAEQRAARIRVFADGEERELLADTGWERSLDSLAAPVPVALLPRTGYWWRVAVQGEKESAESALQYFETGKRDEPWTGQWITCDSKEARHPFFEKEITPAGRVRSARLYVCGLGLYEAYYCPDGGERAKIGEELLTPYSNDYHRWVQAQTYDVTELLQQRGTLSLLLGNGWYKSRFGFAATEDRGYYGDEWKLIAEVHLLYEDGTREVIGTDETWTVRRSHITFSNLYDGEWMDRTAPDLPRERARRTDPPAGRLCDRWSLPVRKQEEMPGLAILHTPAGETVVDFGQNFAGIFALRVQEPAGTLIRIQAGETLIDGNFSNENLRTARAEYRYVSDGTPDVIRPHFTYYGYRYLKIEGIRELRPGDISGYAIYSDLSMRGDIRTGNPLVNQLISNIRWGMKSNFVDVPTDCPQRDERMGWTADTQIFSTTACYLADTAAFYGKYLHDVFEEQLEHGGYVPDVVPSAGVRSTSSVWGDAAVILPWTLYTFYGDPAILEQQYDSMKAWVDYIRRVDGEDHHWREVFHYGDWLALDHPSGNPGEVKGATEEGFIASIYYAASAGILSRAAGILGRREDEAAYGALADQEFDAVRHDYYTGSGRCCIRTQTAALLTLKYGLSSDPEGARRELLRQLSYSGGKLRTGFVGTPLLLDGLSDAGFPELSWQIFLSEEYPGWLREVKLGATTVWERWNSLGDDGHFTSLDMNSLNHYAEGSVLSWLFGHGAGIRPLSPGFKSALIAPEISRELGSLSCTYESAAGAFALSWTVGASDQVSIRLTVPFGCSAVVRLPMAPALVSCNGIPVAEPGVLFAGSYEFRYQLTGPFHHYSIDTPIRELKKEPGLRDRVPLASRLDAATEMFMSYTVRQFAGQMTELYTPAELMELDEALREL